jgi:hypothetical protein
MTKFRLVVFYEDRYALRDLIDVAQYYNVQIHHDKEKRAVVYDIDSASLLVIISRALYQYVE